VNWFSEASCKDKRTSDFFDNFEEADAKQRMKVLSTCANCKVRIECQNYADSFKDTYGLWGGIFYRYGKKHDGLKVKRSAGAKETATEIVLA
jgi:hypothetical protein